MLESKPLNALAKIAFRELNKNTAAAMQEILEAAAPVDGIGPKDGWQFDPQSAAWVREVPDAPAAE